MDRIVHAAVLATTLLLLCGAGFRRQTHCSHSAVEFVVDWSMKRVTSGPYLELACQRINLAADGDIFPNVLPRYAGVTRQRPGGGTQGCQRRLAAGQRLDGLRRGLLRVEFQEAALQHVLHLRRQGQGFAVEGFKVSRKLRFSMSSTCIVRDKGLGLIV